MTDEILKRMENRRVYKKKVSKLLKMYAKELGTKYVRNGMVTYEQILKTPAVQVDFNLHKYLAGRTW